MNSAQSTTLEVDQDIRLERLEWFIQRTGWVLMGVLIAASILGLFGKGVLSEVSERTEKKGSQLEVRFQRYLRYEAPEQLTITVSRSKAASDGNDEAVLSIGSRFFEKVKLDYFVPEPVRTEVKQDHYLFFFKNSADYLRLDFSFKPVESGALNYEVGIEGIGTLNIKQYIYP